MNINENKINFTEKISPSIFAADFARIKDEVKKIEKFGCKYIHLDIMDGNFVPNISYGPKVTADILNITNLSADLHLMVDNPSFFIDKFIFEKIEYITFHYEAIKEIKTIYELIEKIRNFGKKPGISIKPGTKVEKIIPFLKLIDLVLVMTVEPGFSGQKMIEDCITKISQLKTIRNENKYNYFIQVDGGINFSNVSSIIEKGADLVVIGSAFFEK